MNRIGLLIALAIAVVVGIVFAIDPALDLRISARFFDPGLKLFPMLYSRWMNAFRDFFSILIVLLAALPLLWRHIHRLRQLPSSGALLLWSTLAIGPGLLTNAVLKEYWGRPRPQSVTQFGGPMTFVPWWDPRGQCTDNCSFVSGESSTAAWTAAPAAIMPPAWRALAYALSFMLFASIACVRLAAGAHFVTDLVFGGVFTFLIVWGAHALIFGRMAAATVSGATPPPLARLDRRIESALDRMHDYLMSPGGRWLFVLLVLTIVRLVGLRLSKVDLFYDESQYWAWSHELAFGYFSKPPLLAWVMAGAEAVCGNQPHCVRSPSPVLYLGTCVAVYFLARALYDARTGVWSALVFATAPGVVFSTRIISTDVPLLFCWAIALLAYGKLWQQSAPNADRSDERLWTIMLGIAFGLGMLAKYAMIYFLLGAAIAAIIDRDARAMLRRPAPWIALAIGFVVLAPNIWWNFQNGFVTLKHTGDNIEGGGAQFSLGNGLEFVGAQFGVIGPIIFAGLLVLFARMMSPKLQPADRIMLAFAIPALALVTITGFVTRANANWAAPSFVSAVIVVVAVLVRNGSWRLIGASIAIGAVAQIGLLIGDSVADRLSIAGLAKPDVYARTMGWHALGDRAGVLAAHTGARTIVAEQRDDVASLLYYQRDASWQVLAWPTSEIPNHQFDITRRFTEKAPEPILLVTRCAATQRLSEQFGQVEALGPQAIPTGPRSTRDYFMFRLAAHSGPIRPLGPCQ